MNLAIFISTLDHNLINKSNMLKCDSLHSH